MAEKGKSAYFSCEQSLGKKVMLGGCIVLIIALIIVITSIASH